MCSCLLPSSASPIGCDGEDATSGDELGEATAAVAIGLEGDNGLEIGND